MTNHFDGKRFHNINKMAKPFRLKGLLQWILSRNRARWPTKISNKYSDHPPANIPGQEIRISFIGHATFLIQTQGINILTDPVFSERASAVSWFGPKRINDPGIALKNLPKIDIVLISHGHYDHLDINSLKILCQNHDIQIFTPLGNEVAINKNIPNANVISMDWYESKNSINNIKICLEPAQHWSARGLFDINKALWGTFIIKTLNGNICFIGDTGYDDQIFKSIGEKYDKMRVSIIPIGAYEPRWFMKYIHVNPHEAVMIHQDLYSELSIASHFGTFQLTDEALDAPLMALDEARNSLNVQNKFITLEIGTSIML
jgi:L-ascorbate metabolism protein UlaG (beta-lactamase superfamily)